MTVAFRMPICGARRTASRLPAVRVVFLARNEATVLPPQRLPLRDQVAPPLGIMVVDDAFTDGTASVARAYGADVVVSKPLPDGWKGKPWACHQGAWVARNNLLCFVDADTRFEPGGLARVLDC